MENREALVIDGAALKAARLAQRRDLTDLAREMCMSTAQIKQIEDGGERSFYHPQHKIACTRRYAQLLGLPVEAVVRDPQAPPPGAAPPAESAAPASTPAARQDAEPAFAAAPVTASATAVATAAADGPQTAPDATPIHAADPIASAVSTPSTAPTDRPADLFALPAAGATAETTSAATAGTAHVPDLGAELDLDNDDKEAEPDTLAEFDLAAGPAAHPEAPAAEAAADAPRADDAAAEAPVRFGALKLLLALVLLGGAGWVAWVGPDQAAALLPWNIGPAKPAAPAGSPAGANPGTDAGSAPADAAAPAAAAAATPTSAANAGAEAKTEAGAAASADATAKPVADETQAADCGDADAPVTAWRAATPRKPGDTVYLEARQAATVCVADADGMRYRAKITPQAGRAFQGKPPFVVQAAKLEDVDVYFQGNKVKLASGAKAVRLIAQPVPKEDAAN